jgi:hypothetical protein
MGINITNSLTGLIYKKALKFSLMRSLDHSSGSVMNYVQVDAQKFMQMTGFFSMISFPVTIVIGSYLLYNYIQFALIPGLVVMGLLSYWNYVLAERFYE